MFCLMINDFYIFGCLLIKIVVSCYMRAKNNFLCVQCVKFLCCLTLQNKSLLSETAGAKEKMSLGVKKEEGVLCRR